MNTAHKKKTSTNPNPKDLVLKGSDPKRPHNSQDNFKDIRLNYQRDVVRGRTYLDPCLRDYFEIV